jgi:hypothetical protein
MDYLDRVPNTEPVNKLDAYLTALASERNRVAELKAKVEAERVTALLNSNFHQLLDELEHAKKNESMFYDEIKKIALERTAKGQTLPNAVTVKNFKKVVLCQSVEMMREWCIDNLPGALLPDFDVLGGAVKLGIVPDEIGFIVEEKRAQVAQDLSEWLDKS